MLDFKYGDIYIDPIKGHKIACLDATKKDDIQKLMLDEKASLAIHDPPYNISINKEFSRIALSQYMDFSEKYIDNTILYLKENSSLYVWLGADIKNNLQPFIEFCLLMRNKQTKLKSYITMRNQKGFGTQKNWMFLRQELLYYVIGDPIFNIEGDSTEIKRGKNGYTMKDKNGNIVHNQDTCKSENIRAGNVWYDITQVLYNVEENISGCYAQKPLKAIERIVKASSGENDLIIDFFGHSGTTLLAAEKLNRKCYSIDISPDYCQIMKARLEHYRKSGFTGFGRDKIIIDGKTRKDLDILI